MSMTPVAALVVVSCAGLCAYFLAAARDRRQQRADVQRRLVDLGWL